VASSSGPPNQPNNFRARCAARFNPTVTLKGLERDGLITRTVYPTIPPCVEYELTKLGHSLLNPIKELGVWAGQNRERIQIARNRYDAQKPKNLQGIR